MKNSNKIVTGFFSLLAICLTGNAVTAQNENTLRHLEIGARFMPTISLFDIHDAGGGIVKGDASLTYGFGGLIGVNFTKNVGLQGEVLYNSISQKYKDQDLQHTITVNYINVPILLALNTDKTKPVNLNLVVGPQLGLNLGSKFETTGSTAETDTLEAIVAVKQSDFGIAYGAGLEFCLNNAHTLNLGVGFRGVYGLVDISDNSNTTATRSYYVLDRTNIKTNAGYIGLSILF